MIVIFRECFEDEVHGALERGPWHVCAVEAYYRSSTPPHVALTSLWFAATIGM